MASKPLSRRRSSRSALLLLSVFVITLSLSYSASTTTTTTTTTSSSNSLRRINERVLEEESDPANEDPNIVASLEEEQLLAEKEVNYSNPTDPSLENLDQQTPPENESIPLPETQTTNPPKTKKTKRKKSSSTTSKLTIKKKEPKKEAKKNDDDIFASMGLSAKPTFSKPTKFAGASALKPSSYGKTSAGSSTWKSSASEGLTAEEHGDDWDDDDLDDLLDD